MFSAIASKLLLGVLLLFGIDVTATSIPDANIILNFLSLAILVAGLFLAPRALRAKTAEAQIAEKDKIIAGHKQLIELREEEAQAAKEKAAELGELLDTARADATGWQARYEEQSQYTAAPALDAIRQLMEHSNADADRRHRELLLALRALRALAPRDSQRPVDGADEES